MYERLEIQEYGVVNVEAAAVIALMTLPTDPSSGIAAGGSRQMEVSAVRLGLSISVIEAALRRSQTKNDGAVNRWLTWRKAAQQNG